MDAHLNIRPDALLQVHARQILTMLTRSMLLEMLQKGASSAVVEVNDILCWVVKDRGEDGLIQYRWSIPDASVRVPSDPDLRHACDDAARALVNILAGALQCMRRRVA